MKPKLVIVPGHLAAYYSVRPMNLSEVVGGVILSKEESVEYNPVPTFHSSETNGPSREVFERQHKKPLKTAGPYVEQVKRDAKIE